MIVPPNITREVKDLNRRYADLLELEDVDPDTLAALWSSLADDYEAEDYRFLAYKCRNHAAKAKGEIYHA